MAKVEETVINPPPPIPTIGGGFAALVQEHASTLPQSNPEAIAAEEERQAEEEGKNLDPEIYAFDEHGRPKKNKDGSWKKRTGPKAADQKNPQDEFEALGMVASETMFSGLCLFLGADWQPDDEERKRLYHAFGVYLRAKGYSDIPPGWLLAGAIGSYVRPRVSKPDTTTRLTLFALWVRRKIGAVWTRIFRRKPTLGHPPEN